MYDVAKCDFNALVSAAETASKSKVWSVFHNASVMTIPEKRPALRLILTDHVKIRASSEKRGSKQPTGFESFYNWCLDNDYIDPCWDE